MSMIYPDNAEPRQYICSRRKRLTTSYQVIDLVDPKFNVERVRARFGTRFESIIKHLPLIAPSNYSVMGVEGLSSGRPGSKEKEGGKRRKRGGGLYSNRITCSAIE